MPAVDKACGAPEHMPAQQQLLHVPNGYSSLYSAISKHYGGMYSFATRIELPMQHKNAPDNYFRELSPLQAALLEFVVEHGTTKTMPTKAQLLTHRRSDLTNAMQLYHDGVPAVTDRLELDWGWR